MKVFQYNTAIIIILHGGVLLLKDFCHCNEVYFSLVVGGQDEDIRSSMVCDTVYPSQQLL